MPVANILLPAGLETVGTIAFTLLATKYLLAKDGDLAEDFDELLSSVPEDSPKNLKDVVDLVSPAVKVGSKIVKAAAETDVEEVADELKEAVEDLPETVQNIESPVEELGPTAAILGASYVTNRVAHASVLALSLPRLLELAGAGVLIYALGRYADDESDFMLREDLEDLKEETRESSRKPPGLTSTVMTTNYKQQQQQQQQRAIKWSRDLTTKERRIKSLFNYIIYRYDMMNTSKSDKENFTHTHTHTHTQIR